MGNSKGANMIMNTQRRRILYILLGIGIAALVAGLVFLLTYSG
jgi:hypothetical protein